MTGRIELRAGHLTLAGAAPDLRSAGGARRSAPDDRAAHRRRRGSLVGRIVSAGDAAYGINTGFGLLAQTRIPDDQLALLQRNLLLSHAAGVGEPLPDAGGAIDPGAQDQCARARLLGHFRGS